MLKYRIIYAAALILSAATFVYTNTAMSLIFLAMVVLIPILRSTMRVKFVLNVIWMNIALSARTMPCWK